MWICNASNLLAEVFLEMFWKLKIGTSVCICWQKPDWTCHRNKSVLLYERKPLECRAISKPGLANNCMNPTCNNHQKWTTILLILIIVPTLLYIYRVIQKQLFRFLSITFNTLKLETEFEFCWKKQRFFLAHAGT